MENLILTQIPIEELKTAISQAVKTEIEKINFSPKENYEPEFLTRQQVCEILGISLPTLHHWSRNGLLPSFRIGSRVRYKKEDVSKSLIQVRTLKGGGHQNGK
jgi:excisionase family DNA binding protein